MRLIDLDEFFRQNCIDRMEGKSCEECRHHVLEVSCERLMEQPTAERVGKWIELYAGNYKCSVCGDWWGNDNNEMVEDFKYCPNCGARMEQ